MVSSDSPHLVAFSLYSPQSAAGLQKRRRVCQHATSFCSSNSRAAPHGSSGCQSKTDLERPQLLLAACVYLQHCVRRTEENLGDQSLPQQEQCWQQQQSGGFGENCTAASSQLRKSCSHQPRPCRGQLLRRLLGSHHLQKRSPGPGKGNEDVGTTFRSAQAAWPMGLRQAPAAAPAAAAAPTAQGAGQPAW